MTEDEKIDKVSSSGAQDASTKKNVQAYNKSDQKQRRLVKKTKSFDDRAQNVRDLAALKGKRPIVALTAYDAVMGRLVCNDAGVDFILVGDSVGIPQPLQGKIKPRYL